MNSPKDFSRLGRQTLEIERDAIGALIDRVGEDFDRACRLMLDCRGRVVVTGMGKSGHIGSKIAATLASTGTPAFFLHPAEASHGDLGMVTRQDVVLALSNSGESSEIASILPLFKRMGAPVIAMTGRPESTLARAAEVHLDVSVDKEACPLNLAPTASTTATLAMGDALAVALLEARGFTEEDFAMSHPGGSLGRRLLLRIRDVMRSGEQLPRVAPGTSLSDTLLEMTRKGMGMTAVIDAAGTVVGIYTDGDLRRTLDHGGDIRDLRVDEVMTRGGYSVPADHLAAEAVKLMEQHKVSVLLVKDGEERLVGAVHMHDLLRAGVV